MKKKHVKILFIAELIIGLILMIYFAVNEEIFLCYFTVAIIWVVSGVTYEEGIIRNKN